MSSERRKFSRVKFDTDVKLIKGLESFAGKLLDVSLKGALVELQGASSLSRGDDCVLDISLNNREIVLEVEARLVFHKDSHLGFRFFDIELESMVHLRRLIELNIGDPDKINDELFFLANS